MGLLHFASAVFVHCFLLPIWQSFYLISGEIWLPISGHHLISMFNLSFPIHDSFFLSLRAFVFWFGFHGVMHLAASIFWIRKMWIWWIHLTRKRVSHWRILSLLRCTWLIVRSLLCLLSISTILVFMHLMPLLCSLTFTFLVVACNYHSYASWCRVWFWICSCYWHP